MAPELNRISKHIVSGVPLRIVMPIYLYFPVIMWGVEQQALRIVGGAEQQARRIAEELASRGNRVTIVTGWWNRKTSKHEEDGHVAIYRNTVLWDLFDRCSLLRTFRHYTYEISLGWYLWRNRTKYDIIHVHSALHAAVVSTIVGKFVDKPVVVKVGCGGEFGDMHRMKGCQASPFGKLFWNIIKECDAIVAISRQIREELLGDGFAPKKVISIPNGISSSRLNVKTGYQLSSTPQIISVGRLVPQKGFDVLINALSMLPASLSVASTIFGDGTDRCLLSSQIVSLGLEAKISLPGIVHDVEGILIDSDVFILPSKAEGMSNALMEAMAAGLPCIATHVGGNNDLIDPTALAPSQIVSGTFYVCKNGILVAPGDSVGLKNALVFLFENEDVRVSTGKSARKWISENVLLDSVVDKYIKLYLTLSPFHSAR